MPYVIEAAPGRYLDKDYAITRDLNQARVWRDLETANSRADSFETIREVVLTLVEGEE